MRQVGEMCASAMQGFVVGENPEMNIFFSQDKGMIRFTFYFLIFFEHRINKS